MLLAFVFHSEIAGLRAKLNRSIRALDAAEDFLEKDSDLFDEYCSKVDKETTAEGQDDNTVGANTNLSNAVAVDREQHRANLGTERRHHRAHILIDSSDEDDDEDINKDSSGNATERASANNNPIGAAGADGDIGAEDDGDIGMNIGIGTCHDGNTALASPGDADYSKSPEEWANRKAPNLIHRLQQLGGDIETNHTTAANRTATLNTDGGATANNRSMIIDDREELVVEQDLQIEHLCGKVSYLKSKIEDLKRDNEDLKKENSANIKDYNRLVGKYDDVVEKYQEDEVNEQLKLLLEKIELLDNIQQRLSALEGREQAAEEEEEEEEEAVEEEKEEDDDDDDAAPTTTITTTTTPEVLQTPPSSTPPTIRSGRVTLLPPTDEREDPDMDNGGRIAIASAATTGGRNNKYDECPPTDER